MKRTSSPTKWRLVGALLTLLAVLAMAPAVTSAQTLAGTESGTANLIFDPNVTEHDRELVTEAVHLAESFFAARYMVAMGAEVTVSVLPIPSPLDPYLTAATYGSSIVFYTKSLGWLESPPAERVRVVIHEYTHAYQFSKTAEHPLESAAWFEEGAAEYLSMVAISELGLMDRNAVEGYYGSVVTYRAMPSLQDLEGYSVMQAQTGDVYYLMYFGVAHVMQGLPLTSIDAYYTGIGQGASFATAFEQAFGVAPADFYAGFAQFRATGLPQMQDFPPEFEVSEGIDLPSPVAPERVPLLVISGEQALIVAESTPGANCTLDMTIVDDSVLGDSRETFTNGAGQVFWLVTIPPDLPSGRATFELACGGELFIAPVLVA